MVNQEKKEIAKIISKSEFPNSSCWDNCNKCFYKSNCNYLKAGEELFNEGWRKQVEAEWKPYTEYYADDYSECNTRKVWACSRCGRLEKQKEPYCNCGAKMI